MSGVHKESWLSGLKCLIANEVGLIAPIGSNPILSAIRKVVRVWFIVPVLKTGSRCKTARGFKSHIFLLLLGVYTVGVAGLPVKQLTSVSGGSTPSAPTIIIFDYFF